jgi:alpha-glucosidase
MNPDYLIPLGKVSSFTTTSNSITFAVDSEFAEFTFLSEKIVRLRITQGGYFITKPSEACLDVNWPSTGFTTEETSETVTIKTSSLIIEINKTQFAPKILRIDKSCILEQHQDIPFYQYQNNHFVVTRSALPHEHIYGLGEKTGQLDRHGRSYKMWNKDVLAPDPHKKIEDLIAEKESDPLATDFDPYYMSIPFYYRLHPESLDAAGYFIDNPYSSTYTFNNQKNHSHIQIHYEGGQYCEYFFAETAISHILQDYCKLTGTIERPPLWALGYHQCRWKKYSTADILAIAQKQRSSDSPCDVLWLDIDYMDEYRVFTWNDELLPGRQALFSKLEELGFRIITIIDPGVKFEPGYEIFDQAKKQDLLCKCENGQIYIGQVWPGKTAFPDFSKKECREWWGNLNAEHVKNGIAGIWNDMNEPATGEIDYTDMRFAGDDNGNYPHQRYHNEYALLMAMATVEGLKKSAPEQRTFVLSRAGSPGIQRYAANWLGDNASRWEHLQMSLPMAMGLSLSGQPFIGADIGGFVEACSPELFIRWMQCGAFYPFCRNHNDHPADQYIWSFGHAASEICKSAIQLRYKLLPYIYSQFVQSSHHGNSIMKALIINYQNDPTVRQIEDQFLVGDHILVAPVLEVGQTSRTLYLPEGEWFDMNNKKKYLGQQWISIDAPIEQIPWFIKCGHIIPMLDKAPNSTMNLEQEKTVLLLALPDNKDQYRSKLYEDDGLTTEFAQGFSLETTFNFNNTVSPATLSGRTQGLKPQSFQRQAFKLQLAENSQIKTIHIHKKSLLEKEGFYEFKNCGEDFSLRLK